jgi:hypothetical protein
MRNPSSVRAVHPCAKAGLDAIFPEDPLLDFHFVVQKQSGRAQVSVALFMRIRMATSTSLHGPPGSETT